MTAWPLYVDVNPKDVRAELSLLRKALCKRRRLREDVPSRAFSLPALSLEVRNHARLALRDGMIRDATYRRIMRLTEAIERDYERKQRQAA